MKKSVKVIYCLCGQVVMVAMILVFSMYLDNAWIDDSVFDVSSVNHFKETMIGWGLEHDQLSFFRGAVTQMFDHMAVANDVISVKNKLLFVYGVFVILLSFFMVLKIRTNKTGINIWFFLFGRMFIVVIMFALIGFTEMLTTNDLGACCIDDVGELESSLFDLRRPLENYQILKINDVLSQYDEYMKSAGKVIKHKNYLLLIMVIIFTFQSFFWGVVLHKNDH